MAITINDSYLQRIKAVLAYPSVDNIILTDDQIKSLCIQPAFERYFIKFPLKYKVEYSLSASATNTIDFPDETTYGVTDLRVVDKATSQGTGGTSFWDLVAYQSQSSMGGTGNYGIPQYNPSFMRQTRLLQMTANASQSNLGTTSCRVDYPNRQVVVYSTITGKINVEWAKYSENFADIRYTYIQDVIKLCQGYMLNHLADTTKIISMQSGPEINYSELKTHGEELISSVLEKWGQIPDIVLIRMA